MKGQISKDLFALYLHWAPGEIDGLGPGLPILTWGLLLLIALGGLLALLGVRTLGLLPVNATMLFSEGEATGKVVCLTENMPRAHPATPPPSNVWLCWAVAA